MSEICFATSLDRENVTSARIWIQLKDMRIFELLFYRRGMWFKIIQTQKLFNSSEVGFLLTINAITSLKKNKLTIIFKTGYVLAFIMECYVSIGLSDVRILITVQPFFFKL